MLRHVLLSSAALAALTSASFAADLPSRKAPAPVPYVAAPIFTWTGFYLGAEIGAGWLNDKGRFFAPGPVGSLNYDRNNAGVVGGGFAGYNWQLSNSIVIGAEADIEGTSITSNTVAPTISESLPWQGSLRGRLGYAMNNALFYATGGLAFGQIDTRYPGFNFSGTQPGWTLGGGIEYAFNNNWFARAEYRYTSFSGFTDTAVVPPTVSVKHAPNENAVRFGVGYKFGGPSGSVVAKY
jgi:outer membrane immunogenic protein